MIYKSSLKRLIATIITHGEARLAMANNWKAFKALAAHWNIILDDSPSRREHLTH